MRFYIRRASHEGGVLKVADFCLPGNAKKIKIKLFALFAGRVSFGCQLSRGRAFKRDRLWKFGAIPNRPGSQGTVCVGEFS